MNNSAEQQLTPEEIKNKFLEGNRLTLKKLVEKKALQGDFLILSVAGKPTQVPAKDIKL